MSSSMSGSVAGTRSGSVVAGSGGASRMPTLGSISHGVSMLDNVDGRYNPLMVPSAQKVISRKKDVLDRSITYASLPKSYASNSAKESLLLEYVEDFRRQFVQVFPARRPLTLCPLNECGVRKFLPSTVRPSLLPYHDVYDLAEAAQFVADYLTFMPLDEPTRLPDLVPSTMTVLQVRKGDCMDMSIFLVSLLRGAGYNAFVVTGYAPQWVTEADQSGVVCPLLPDQVELARKAKEESLRKAEEAKRHNKYSILQKPDHTSKYRAARVQEKEDLAAQVVADEEARVRKIKEKAADPLHGQRAHAWVLVTRGRRDVTEELFVEATTGVVYPVTHAPYLAVDALFNEHNYWVNVQQRAGGAMLPLAEMAWDLSSGNAWEYVVIDERRYRDSVLQRKDVFGSTVSAGPAAAPVSAASASAASSASASAASASAAASSSSAAASGSGGDGSDGSSVSASNSGPKDPVPEESFDDRSILDASMSWTAPIRLSREDFQARYPLGSKTVAFKDCTVQLWSPYARGMVGLVRRVQVYQENKTLEQREPVLLECWERFQHRKDKLLERRTFPPEDRVVASYAPGLLSGLQSYQRCPSASLRSFTFYPGARVDGLVAREESPEKVVERYAQRDDRLVYRSYTVDKRGQGARAAAAKPTLLPKGSRGTEVPVAKIAEKYSRDLATPAEDDVAKRTHFLTSNTIRLDFHLGEHHVTHSVHLLDKSDKLEQSETEGRQVGSVGSLLRVDPSWQERSRGEEQQMVSKLLLLEKELKLKLKAREEAMIKETLRLDEELDDSAGKILLEKSMYDVAYEAAKIAEMQGPEMQGSSDAEEARRNDKNKVDYLSPFLAQYPSAGGKPLTRRQAQQAKDECLATLKERLLERANIIQQHLDEETAKLHQRQSLFKRQAGSGAVEASEEFNRFSNQCLFRIDILNARRARHEELALKKYVELDERLNNDPRLAALHQQD